MRARVCILFGVSVLIIASETRAARMDGVVPLRGTTPCHDTCRVSTIEDYLRSRPGRGHRLAGLAALGDASGLSRHPDRALLGGTPTGETPGPVADQDLWGADGNVLSIARTGNTLYIAGSFRSVGANTGGCVAFDERTGQATQWFPKVAGSVNTIVPDGAGGWFIGGEFSGVGGKTRACLAQVRPDGSVSDWSPSVTGSPGYIDPPVVRTIAVYGSRVYIGGAFRMINDQPRMSFGCVDASAGAVLDWTADLAVDEYITALTLHRDTLLVGGSFSSVGGVARSGLAALSASTGDLLPWQVDLYGRANTLLASGDTLYVGGTFTEIAGVGYSKLAAVDIARGYPLPIDFRFGGVWHQYAPLLQVCALTKVGDTLYVAGNFTQLGGQDRSCVAAVDAGTGDALAWTPDTVGPRSDGWPPPMCTSLCVAGGSLHVGGYFSAVEGQSHQFLASWDRLSGRVSDWAPAPDDVPTVIATLGDTLLVGGFFHMVSGWQHRAGLAAIDLVTGRLKPWNPNPNGGICTSVAVSAGRVFVSGDFSTIGGDPQPRSFFAALDTVGGLVTTLDPGANDVATVFLLEGDTLYLGGMFTEVGGQARNGLAAINATTGMVLPWDPNAVSYFDGYFPVYTMARSQDTIYLGGTFTEMGGQPRRGLAAVDANTGELNPWSPVTDNSTVYALLISGSTLYVGGAFGMIGGQPQQSLAALDLRTGQPTGWRPSLTEWDVVNPRVRALVLVDSVLYVGGSFASIGGQPRICLGGVDTATGAATDWDPGTDGLVWSLTNSGSTLYAGGGFSRAGGIPANDLAAFKWEASPLAPPDALELARCFPNPVHATAEIRFGLPSTMRVTLSIFDIQGRRIVVPLNRSVLEAGRHAVQIQTKGWRPGMYLYRLEAEGRSATRKMVVIG